MLAEISTKIPNEEKSKIYKKNLKVLIINISYIVCKLEEFFILFYEIELEI